MINYIWSIFIIFGFCFSLLTGNIQNINSAIFESAKNAVEMSITFLGSMCLWNGIIRIIENTTLIEQSKKLIKPFMKILFPRLNKASMAYNKIIMNIIANILGLGNAATPLGISAIKELQKINTNKERISNEMAMLIVLNTASIQLIPTTVIAIRSSLGSSNATAIIIPIWCATIAADVAGIVATKMLMKKF